MSTTASNAAIYAHRKRRRRMVPETCNEMDQTSDSNTCRAMSAHTFTAKAPMALCCLLLLTRSPPGTSFQISPRLPFAVTIPSQNRVMPPLRSGRFPKFALGATRETLRSDEPDVTLKDQGPNDEGGISDEDKMTIPLMDTEKVDLSTSSSSDGSDLPGTADAFDYAWDRSSQAFLDWTSGTSIGSFLLQRQREEEDAVIIREVDAQTGQAEYSTETGGGRSPEPSSISSVGSSKVDDARSDSEQLVRHQSRRMEGRKRRKERKKERMVEAQLEELREQQRKRQQQQTGGVGGVQIIDNTSMSGVGKQIIEDEKSSADVAKRGKRKDGADREERKSRARLWRRKKRDRAKARQKGFDVDRELASQVDGAITPLKTDRSTIMNQINVLDMTDSEIPSRVRVIMPPSAEEKIDTAHRPPSHLVERP